MTSKPDAKRSKPSTASKVVSVGLSAQHFAEIEPATASEIETKATSLRTAAPAAVSALEALATLMEQSPGPVKGACTPVPNDAYSHAHHDAKESLLAGYGITEIPESLSEHDPLSFVFTGSMTYGRRLSFEEGVGELFLAYEAAIALISYVPRPSRPPMPQRLNVAADFPGKVRAAARRIKHAAVGTTGGGPSANMREAKWFDKATQQSLYPDLLRGWWNDGHIVGKKSSSRRNRYSVNSVMEKAPEHRAKLQAALDAEARQSAP